VIILLTTSTNVRDIEKAKKYNITAYLEKPLSEDKLKKALAGYQLKGLTD
jgi:AmiR/NasT family two-component response regulator